MSNCALYSDQEAGGDCRGVKPSGLTLETIPADYRRQYGHPKDGDCCRDEWAHYCRGLPSLKEAIMAAALARKADNELHGHQRMVDTKKLEALGNVLCEQEQAIQSAPDFETLHRIVRDAGVFKREEALAVFDTALRLGCRLKKCPAVIYLHRGTKAGAEKLLGKDVIEGQTILPKSVLPRPLATDLNECELEDVLCIYKDCFEKALAQHHNSCKRKG